MLALEDINAIINQTHVFLRRNTFFKYEYICFWVLLWSGALRLTEIVAIV